MDWNTVVVLTVNDVNKKSSFYRIDEDEIYKIVGNSIGTKFDFFEPHEIMAKEEAASALAQIGGIVDGNKITFSEKEIETALKKNAEKAYNCIKAKFEELSPEDGIEKMQNFASEVANAFQDHCIYVVLDEPFGRVYKDEVSLFEDLIRMRECGRLPETFSIEVEEVLSGEYFSD